MAVAVAMLGRGSLLAGLLLLQCCALASARTDDLTVTLSAAQPWVYLGKFGFTVGNRSTVSQPAASEPSSLRTQAACTRWIDVNWEG